MTAADDDVVAAVAVRKARRLLEQASPVSHTPDRSKEDGIRFEVGGANANVDVTRSSAAAETSHRRVVVVTVMAMNGGG